MAIPSRRLAEEMDAADPLAPFCDDFIIADPDTIRLDGNSLSRLPAATPDFLDHVIRREWGSGMMRAWETWFGWERRLGDKLGTRLLGADEGEVLFADSTSVNLYKLAVAALDALPGRRTLVFDADDFATNRYVIQGLAQARGLKLRVLHPDPNEGLSLHELRAALDTDVALVSLSLVSHCCGALLDMGAINEAVKKIGGLVLWDLSHAVGAVPVRLGELGADLAVGSSYKYLHGGPGAPAFLYVRKELQSVLRQPIWGWFGQRDQFRMAPEYEPAEGLGRFLVGTPPVLSLAAVEPGLEITLRAGIERVREKSRRLGELVVTLADHWLRPFGFRLASPRDPELRGGHVTLEHPAAHELCQDLADGGGVIAAYRVPNRLRLAPAPLSSRFTDVWDAMDRLRTRAEKPTSVGA